MNTVRIVFLSVVAALVSVAGIVAAQSQITKKPGVAPPPNAPKLSGRLEVKVMRLSSPPSTVPEAVVCVGDADNPQRYGMMIARKDGTAVFTGVPLTTDLLVTASGKHRQQADGGARIEHRMRGASDVAEIAIPWGKGDGPTCTTPGRSKALPADANLNPSLKAPLRTNAVAIAQQRRVLLFTHKGSPWDYLAVAGKPTHFRTSQNPTLSDATWRSATVTDGERMHFVHHDIQGGDGRKTIYFQLKNSRAWSPPYSVEVNFAELYRCELEYERADNALAPMGEPQGNLGKERLSLLRAESKTLNVAWPSPNEKKRGYGMHLRRARNVGDRPVELTIGGGPVWNKHVLQPGAGAKFRHDLKAVRCP